MGVLHAALAWLAAGSVVVVLLLAVATATGRPTSYRALDLTLLGQVAVTGLTALAGAAAWATLAPPSDGLHVVYGGVATFLPMGARIAAQGRPARSIGRWVAVAALVALGSTIRSFMTGS